MYINTRLQRRIYLYSFLFKKLGILSEQEFNNIIKFDQMHENR
ncbi:hypothetical protein PH210_18540 [Paenibacillus sp. BSR1-1]|nr:hypothetical protein [Paenibacillus sp. BSR1-1]MDN3018179.1 hypothetical protein [Paenibacillus sp. BSR1-1]